MGLIFDAQARAVRPVFGVPGAAFAGDPLVSDADAAWIAPGGSAALVLRAARLEVYAASGSAVLQDAIGDVELAAWSAGADVVALYSSKTSQVQMIRNVSGTPAPGAAVDVSGLPGRVSSLACDGQRVILAVVSNSGGGIYAVAGDGVPHQLASSPSPAAMAVAGADLYFADAQARQIWKIQNYASAPAPLLFSTGASLVSAPVGLQISSDGTRLYIADSGTQKVGVFDTATQSLRGSLDLSFAPTMLQPVGGFAMALDSTRQDGDPVHVLSDGGSDPAAVYFVPIRRGSTSGHNRIRNVPPTH